MLAEDERYFLQQSVSTPCLNAIAKAEGIWIEDTGGRRYMDFHGNNVHHIGYGHPRLKRAIAAQMDALPFAPRRYTCETSVALARKLARNRARQSLESAVHDRRIGRGRSRGQDRAHRDRPPQDAVVLGCVPRRRHRCVGIVGRGAVPIRPGGADGRRREPRRRRSPATTARSAIRSMPTASRSFSCATRLRAHGRLRAVARG